MKLMDRFQKAWFQDFERVAKQVKLERANQDMKWGTQNHDPEWWINILGEEFGESAKAVLEATFGDEPWSEYRKELIQVAATAIAAIQCLDRNGPPNVITDRNQAVRLCPSCAKKAKP